MANEYIIGQIILLQDLITDPATGLPVNDSSDIVTVYKPDGTITSPSPSHSSTTPYATTAQLTPDQPGWWEYVWKSTTAGAGAGRGRFWVSPVP